MKKILLSLCLVAALSLSLGGTVAFLMDTDTDHNTMTVGNVEIGQIESQRKDPDNGFGDDNLDDFVQDKLLIPDSAAEHDAEDESTVYTQNDDWWKNIKAGQDKVVRVQNNSNTPIWMRTVFAFELLEDDNPASDDLVYKHFASQTVGETTYTPATLVEKVQDGVVEINGEKCQLYVYTYPYGLDADRTMSDPSLLEVAFAGAVTQEQMAGIGEKYDIYVCTQAVQKDGMDSLYTEDMTDLDKAKAALDKAFKPISATSYPDWTEQTGGENDGETGGENNGAGDENDEETGD